MAGVSFDGGAPGAPRVGRFLAALRFRVGMFCVVDALYRVVLCAGQPECLPDSRGEMPSLIEKVVVIGASAGGVDALLQIVGELPAGFAAPICAVVHISPDAHSVLPELLTRRGPLKAVHATDNMALEQGRIYIAPPDHHLQIDHDNRLHVWRGAPEHHNRPAVDPLFRSAAEAYGENAIAVVLTGNLDDGTAGAQAIKEHGGVVIVQDPMDADFPSMPRNVLLHSAVDACVPLTGIVPAIVRFVSDLT
jgi:two-component system, chemotaxis family, protein-glutamate methylesterase/glutaminase